MKTISLLLLACLVAAGLARTALAADLVPSSSTGFVLVANKGDRTLGIIDPVAGKQIAAIPEDGNTGHEVVASPDGRLAFVPIYGDSGVGRSGSDGSLLRVMDLAKREVVGTVDFGKGVRPHCAVMGPKNGLLYVTTELDKTVTIIDPHSLRILGSVPTGQAESHMLAITRDGRHGYTANVGSGTVSVLDLEARTLLLLIPVSPTTQRIALSTDDHWVFTADQTRPELAVIDTTSNTVAQRVPLPGVAYGTAPTPDGKWLIAALSREKKVIALDLETMKVAHTFDAPRAPQEVLVQPDGAFAYVSCDASKQVLMLNLKTWQIEKLIDAGPGADGLAWAAKP